MPNTITAAGLTISTQAELIAYFTANLQLIYGSDINVDPDSPDGQWINIMVQAILDVEQLISQVNANFDPDEAFGVILDQRVAINGIQRLPGTFTVTNITLVVNQALTLQGLDQFDLTPFTVSDNAGNQWQLQVTQVIASAGTYVFSFQAAVPGAVLTVPNTITTPVTIVLGVVSVNNPTSYTTLGENEEPDSALKVRRQKSTSLSSQGYLDGLLGALEAITGLTAASVNENYTNTTDGDGVPPHYIWVITQGGAPVDIANAIYTKRNAGCGMFGGTSYVITQKDGSSFEVFWDVVTPENLYIKFQVTSLDGVNAPSIANILARLPILLNPGVHEQVNINDLATLVQQIDNNALVTNSGFSLTSGGSYTPTLTPSTKAKQFAVSASFMIITPIMLSAPNTVSQVSMGVVVVTLAILSAHTAQFTPLGGFGPYTWTLPTNNSGGSVSIAGLYTAGASTGVDVVHVADSLGNIAECTVTVS